MNLYNAIEQLFVEYVIEQLNSCPEKFSAIWFTGETMGKSICSHDRKIQIFIESGEIISPVTPKMFKSQKLRVKQSIAPIIKRDKDYILTQFISK